MTEAEEIKICLSCTKRECNNCFGAKLPTNPLETQWRNEKILKILRKDPTLSCNDVAIECGVAEHTVRKIRKENGIPFTGTRRRWTQEEDDYLKTHTNRETAEMFGRSRDTCNIRRRLLIQKGLL